MKRFLLLVLFCLLTAGACHAQTCVGVVCTAADCTPNSVQAAMNKVDGVQGPPYTTVALPSCSVTWTTPATGNSGAIVKWSPPPNAILQGQSTTSGCTTDGLCNPTTATDGTLITDHVCRFSGGNCTSLGSAVLFSITPNATGTFRMTGISIQQDVANNTCLGNTQNCYTSNNGDVAIFGSGQNTRIDHNHFKNIDGLTLDILGGNIYGVLDHNFVENPVSTHNNFKFEATTWGGGTNDFGDGAWADTTSFGTNKFFFAENNTFINGTNNDCIHGGRYVWRYNSHTDGSIQTHPTGGSGRARGCRATEIYNNVTVGTRPSTFEDFNYMFLSSGPSLIYNNNAGTNHAYQNFLTMHSMRTDNSTYGRNPTPGDWGYCGTHFNGTGSGWDQNLSTVTGRRCLDQPGVGQGDQLKGQFPNACDNTLGCSTFNGQWPNEVLEPVYVWLNTWNGSGGGSYIAVQNSNSTILNNSEYFTDNGANCAQNAASCLTGIGVGTLAQRPVNCVANSQPDTQGNTPGVGWWATDTTTLYRCTATNTWASYYTPFTYPHPLVDTSVPIATFSPASLNVGLAPSGVTSNPSSTVTLTNTGTTSLVVTSIQMANAIFSLVNNTCGPSATVTIASAGTGFTLTPASNCTFQVSFTPGAAQAYGGAALFFDNANNPDSFSLTGIGTGPPSITPGTSFTRNWGKVVVETK